MTVIHKTIALLRCAKYIKRQHYWDVRNIYNDSIIGMCEMDCAKEDFYGVNIMKVTRAVGFMSIYIIISIAI